MGIQVPLPGMGIQVSLPGMGFQMPLPGMGIQMPLPGIWTDTLETESLPVNGGSEKVPTEVIKQQKVEHQDGPSKSFHSLKLGEMTSKVNSLIRRTTVEQ
jgi:hypothetical protein